MVIDKTIGHKHDPLMEVNEVVTVYNFNAQRELKSMVWGMRLPPKTKNLWLVLRSVVHCISLSLGDTVHDPSECHGSFSLLVFV